MRFREIQEGTRCWKGYERKGMKTMFGKRVPNCVKREGIDEAPPGPGGGELGAAIGNFAGKAVNYPLMYIELLKQYRKERDAQKKLNLKRSMQDTADKMSPQEKKQTKTTIDKKMSPERRQAEKDFARLTNKQDK